MYAYHSSTPKKIYQEYPAQGLPRQGGWRTIEGYAYESRQLAQAIILNERYRPQRYARHCTVNFPGICDVKLVKQVWGRVTRSLRRSGIVALYIAEPSKANHIGYHLVIASNPSEATLRKAFRQAIPPDATYTIQRIRSTVNLAYYVAKAGHRHERKRLLFAPHITLNKHGTIGAFWGKPKKALWQEIIARERKVSALRHDPTIRMVTDYLYALVGGATKWQRILRQFATRQPHPETIRKATLWQQSGQGNPYATAGQDTGKPSERPAECQERPVSHVPAWQRPERRQARQEHPSERLARSQARRANLDGTETLLQGATYAPKRATGGATLLCSAKQE
jgi:hypothetical protein